MEIFSLQLAANVFLLYCSRRSPTQTVAKTRLNTISFRSFLFVNRDKGINPKCDKQEEVLYSRSEGTARPATAGACPKKVDGAFSLHFPHSLSCPCYYPKTHSRQAHCSRLLVYCMILTHIVIAITPGRSSTPLTRQSIPRMIRRRVTITLLACDLPAWVIC